jgi:hypothetical protein
LTKEISEFRNHFTKVDILDVGLEGAETEQGQGKDPTSVANFFN